MPDKSNPVLHIRIIGPDTHISAISAYVTELLKQRYEVLEVTTPRLIFGDEDNKKVYISIRNN